MTFVNITALTYPEGMEAVIEQRFGARAHAVDAAEGFQGFELLRPVTGETRYFVVTRWDTEEHFTAWSRARHDGPDTHAEDRKHGMSVDLLGFEVVPSAE